MVVQPAAFFRQSPIRMDRGRKLGLQLRKWRKEKAGLNRTEAVDAVQAMGQELSYSYLAKIESGNRPLQAVSVEIREALRRTYGISAQEWEEATGLHVPPAQHPERAPASQYVEVPLTRRVDVYPAGTGPAWDLEEALEPLYLPADLYSGKELIGLRAMSGSMEPYLPEGAIAVILHDDGLVKPGDFCGVRMSDDGVVVKRFVRELDGGVLLLESLNPEPGEDRLFTAPLGSRIIGKVVRRVLQN